MGRVGMDASSSCARGALPFEACVVGAVDWADVALVLWGDGMPNSTCREPLEASGILHDGLRVGLAEEPLLTLPPTC